MIEPRSLPQIGSKNQGVVAGSSNGAGGNQRRNVHAGILTAAVHDRKSGAVSHLRADGENGPRLGLGIESLLFRAMSYRHSDTRFFQSEGSSNGSGNLQLVPAVNKLSANSEMASRRYSVCYLDGSGNVDAISHQTWVMPQILLIKAAMAAGAVAVALFALLESMTSWGDKLIGAVSTIVAASFAYLAVLAKNRYDKWKDLRSEHRTDAQSLLDRERLADDRIKALITEMQAFHAEQVKGLQATIELLKELSLQEKAMIAQQRELIAQQAAELQRGR